MNEFPSKNQLKKIAKSAITKFIKENEDLISEKIEESIESVFMSKAIMQGKNTKKISRKRIFNRVLKVV